MLTRLRIEQFAIVDRLELDFLGGFSAFTGETGAGKSILVDAIALLLGKSGSEDWIAAGKPYALIEGSFDLSKLSHLPEALTSFVEPGEPLIVTRKLSRDKDSVYRINGQTVSLKMAKQVMPGIASIVGQHDYMQLMTPSNLVDLLDLYGQDKLSILKGEYETAFNQFHVAKAQRDQLAKNIAPDQVEWWRFQLAELEAARLLPDEDEQLEDKKRSYKNESKLHHTLEACLSSVEAMVAAQTAHSKSRATLASLMPEWTTGIEAAEQLDVALSVYHDALVKLQQQLGKSQALSIEEIEKRLDGLFKLKTKYQCQTVNQLLERLNTLNTQINQVEQQDDKLAQQDKWVSQLHSELLEKSLSLSSARQQVALKLGKTITDRLKALHFSHADFAISVKYNGSMLSRSGGDQVDFEVSTNPGHPRLSLAKVASGGELSRIMLAIRSLLFEQQLIPTLIFDEVDAGIGGLTATTVGHYLKAISSTGSQVMCITHLPQIAALADHHWTVQKTVTPDHTTQLTARCLSQSERIQELERMLGGKELMAKIANKST